jgi:hypothetical protein
MQPWFSVAAFCIQEKARQDGASASLVEPLDEGRMLRP